ncbi:MAG: HIT domain-containing protein [Candidatus Obscuribacterales bacterium]|nr:HIT domain-containing protein [Candidatus Obscuribacterales bacterium]
MSSEPNCAICQAGELLNAEFLVFQDENWRIRHSGETNIPGYFILESKRHILDLSEASVEECRSYGPTLKNIMDAVRRTTDCSRVYTFSLAEMVPHYHLHIIPRTEYLPRAYRGRGIMSYPLQPAADAGVVELVCQRVRRLMRTCAL